MILAYAAMWIVAAGFVVFLWMRQMGLKTEIARVHAANYGVYGARKVCGWRSTARGLRWRAAPSSG